MRSRRSRSSGAPIAASGCVGMKMGLTSRAKMPQVGVYEVGLGPADRRDAARGRRRSVAPRYVHPRVEPEIAYLLEAPLTGDRHRRPRRFAAVGAVAPAMEIIDCRYRNFKFALPDVIADNASSSGFVVGAWSRPDADVSNLGIVMEVDGRPVADRLDRRDPGQSLAFARGCGASRRRCARPARGRLDHSCGGSDRGTSAEGRRARAAHDAEYRIGFDPRGGVTSCLSSRSR